MSMVITIDVEKRKQMIRATVPGNVEVAHFNGLLVDYVRTLGAGIILRGLRLMTDFEYEFKLGLANRDLAPDVETVFVLTEAAHVYVSSSIVKEIAENGGDYSRYVPQAVQA